MSTLPQTSYSPQEYLIRERQADYRSEYVNGGVFAMSGASREHNFITGNVYAEIHTQFRGKPCEVYVTDMRVKVHFTGMYTYPDVVAVCGGSSFEDGQVDTLVNPTVIVEVLSPSTEAYDRGEKFTHYRRLQSLQEYVLVAQDKVRIEHFARLNGDSGQWVLTEISDPNGTLHLPSIGCHLALRDIYDRVEVPYAPL